MNLKAINKAVLEAQRFLSRAKLCQGYQGEDDTTFITGNANTGALRRASLDLTRALADMRK
jgi:hypothetical protein